MPNATTHDREMRNLKEAYADALWTWAEVESQIFMIYAAATGVLGIDLRPIREAFFSVHSFEMRMTMTNAAILLWLKNGPQLDTWTQLRKNCGKASRQRGRIAHKTGMHWAPQQTGQHSLYILSEPPWDSDHPKNWGEAKSTGVDVTQLRQWAREWHSVYFALNQFGLELWSEALTPPSASLEPPSY